MKNKKLFYPIFALSLLAIHHNAIADRLMPSDLTYIGAFMVPPTDLYAGMAAVDSTSSISYSPDGNPKKLGNGLPGSLFLSNKGRVAEITIPTPVNNSNFSSLNTAQEIQSSTSIAGTVNQGTNDRFGAVAYMSPKGSQTSAKLYWSSFEYYNVDGTDYNSIGWSDTNLAIPNASGLWHIGPLAGSNWDSPYHGNKHGDYLIPIDQSWANQYTGGRSLLAGRYKEAGSAGGSMGPTLIAIAPWQDGNPPSANTNLTAIPLMSFNSQTGHWKTDTTWMDFRLLNDPDYTYYSPGDRWHGGAWVEKGTKKAIIIVGRHGTYNGTPACPITAYDNGCHGAVGTTVAPYCYGGGGTNCPSGIAVSDSKGYHTGPYRPRFLFIDPDELAQVAQGNRSPNSISAYYSYDPSINWPWSDSDGYNDIAGAAYDPANGYLYIAQANAYRPGGGHNTPWPIIHVYSVNASGTTPPLPIIAPTGLKIVPLSTPSGM